MCLPNSRKTKAATLFLLLVWIAAACASGIKLSDAERAKLDSSLRALVESGGEENVGLRVSQTSDGTAAYAVLIRCTSPESLREAGLSLDSVSNDVITARLTMEEIKTAARLSSVTRIESGVARRPN